MPNITRAQLIEMLLAMEGAAAVTILAETEPQWRKSLDIVTESGITKLANPHIGQVTKLSSVNGIIGNWRYSRAVNNRRAKEIDDVAKLKHFTAERRKWGQRVKQP